MKYAWIDTQRAYYALSEMCPVLAVSISGYRAWKRGGKADRSRLTDAQMLALIRAIHDELKGAYGSLRKSTGSSLAFCPRPVYFESCPVPYA